MIVYMQEGQPSQWIAVRTRETAPRVRPLVTLQHPYHSQPTIQDLDIHINIYAYVYIAEEQHSTIYVGERLCCETFELGVGKLDFNPSMRSITP